MFNKDKGKRYTEEEVNDIVDKRLAKMERRSGDRTGDDVVDRVLAGLNEVTDSLRDLKDREENKKGSKGGGILGGDFEEMLTFFNRLNIDQAGRYGIAKHNAILTGQEPGKGPLGSNGLPIGGPNYDPASGDPTFNGRIIKWLVNAQIFTSRAALAFFMTTIALIKWEILDLVVGGDSDGSGIDFEELIMLQLITGSLTPGSSSSGSNPLDFLSGLFGTGANAVVMSDTPVYSTV